jgi:hypothetical protein
VVDTNFSANLNGIAVDTVVAVFTGSSLATLVQVAASDDEGLGANSRATFAATAGTTYRIWVGSFASNSPGSFTLSYFKEGNIGEFRLDSLPTTVGENQGSVQFTVRRYRAGNVSANVTVSTVNGSATAGSDFTALNTVLNFTSGTSEAGLQKSVNLQMLPDAVFENNENFQVSLSSPTPGGSIVGSPATIQLIDGAPTTAAGFTTGTLRVKETDGSITIPLYRNGIGGYAETKISGNLISSTATESRDYSPVNATIVFQPGQSQGSLTVTILNDGFFEGSETLFLNAASAFPGVGLTGPSTLTITIEDDDLPPAISGRLAANFSSPTIIGSVDIKISATGSVTGKVIMAKGSLPFTGTLVNGRLTVRLSTVPNRTLDIQLVNAATKTYQITLNDGDLGSVSTVSTSATNFSKLTPCPVAGNYTFADNIGGGGVPQLIAATIKGDTLGTATLSGKLFDGTAVVATGAVDSSNIAWVGASIYAGKGRVIAAAVLNTTPETIAFAQVEIIRPGRSNQSVELPPISTGTVNASVARYVPPASGQRVFTIWSGGTGNADLIGGGFGALTTKAFTISTANKITVTTLLPEKLSITITPATGVFTGSVLPTGATAPKPIYGVLLQGGGGSTGLGFFLNGITPGKVTLRGP